ncbi:MAG: hypothetical protein M3Y72_11610 [Acidobacteriota bacterium]|nr:hypothetical protein [Acidobacteriota bacterium]
MDTDIAKAIEIIDRKIASLLQARNQLAQAFGIELSTALTVTATQASRSSIVAFIPGNHQKSRKQSLVQFLKDNGPSSRAEIIARAGLPAGTVSYCLSDKRFFLQLANGDWTFTGSTAQSDHPDEGESTESSDGGLIAIPAQQVLP